MFRDSVEILLRYTDRNSMKLTFRYKRMLFANYMLTIPARPLPLSPTRNSDEALLLNVMNVAIRSVLSLLRYCSQVRVAHEFYFWKIDLISVIFFSIV